MKITLIPGDGIGPEVIDAAKRCVDSLISVDWEVVEAGEPAIKKYGTPLPNEVLESIRRNKIGLKGPITTPIGTGFRSVNVALRQGLGLFANVRPIKTYQGVPSHFGNVDLVIVRENTEDLYIGIEFEEGKDETKQLLQFVKTFTTKDLRPDAGVSLKVNTIYASERIADFAFRYAMENHRKKVTAVHKANILKFSDGLFLKTAQRVAQRYPSIAFEDKIVDNMSMQLVQKPELYDILVCPNLYGDILSDLCAGLVGGLGVAPSANISAECAVFEPVHGSAPKYAGMNKVNPTATILSAVLLLRHLNKLKEAEKLENAVATVLMEGLYVTYDLKNNKESAVGTKEMTDAIIRNL